MAPNPTATTRSVTRNPAVRPDWLFEVSTLLQRALCEEVFAGDIERALLRIVPALPLPAHRAEELALLGLLLQVVWGGHGRSPDGIVDQIQKLTSVAPPPGGARRGAPPAAQAPHA